MNRALRIFPICIGLTLLGVVAAQAGTQLVVPGGYASTVGSTGDYAPLGALNQRIQQDYAASLLSSSGLIVGDQITAIGFRAAAGEPSLQAQTISDYSIWMGPAAVSPGNMSTNFVDNRTSMTLVRSGSLTITSGQFTGGPGLNPFGMIQLTLPYTYTGGNLLIEISHGDFANGVTADTVYPYNNGSAQTASGTGPNATTADAGMFDEAIVMALSVNQVPETSTLAIFACGMFGLIFASRFRKHR